MPHLDGVEHSFVDAGGLRMHVAQAGAGEPLLMLHGWPQNWYAYRHVIPALATTYRVICPDLRGWGWTDAPATGYEKRQMMQDVVNLLDALDIRSGLRLMGHDWGSIIGFMLCVERPDLVQSYVALGGAHLWYKLDLAGLLAFRRFWYQFVVATPGAGSLATASPAFIRLLYRRWSGPNKPWTEEDIDYLTAHLTQPARAKASSLVYRTWLTKELPGNIKGGYAKQTLRTPTLFLHGVVDRCIDPAYVRKGSRHAPNMTVETLEDIGHFVPEEAPAIVIERATAHFAGNP
jgi:pimeloyl-ACP methyl ester carboxylesterase